MWEHREFSHPDRLLLSSDGVHCNAQGQYCLYRIAGIVIRISKWCLTRLLRKAHAQKTELIVSRDRIVP